MFCGDCLVVFRRVEAGLFKRVRNGDVGDALRVIVKNLPGVACDRRIKKPRDHLIGNQKRVSVFALVLGGDGPKALRSRALKRIAEMIERDGAQRRTIDRTHHRRITTARQSLTQTYLQRAELTKLRMRIADDDSPARAGGSPDGVSIVACDDEDQAREGLESEDGRGEKSGAGRLDCAGRRRRPGKHCFVRPHARRLASRENQSAKIGSASHEG